MGETMYRELEGKFIGLDKIFLNEAHLKDNVLYVANVEMEYDSYSGSWERYWDTTVDLLKINTDTKEISYFQYKDEPGYRDSNCDCCSYGYDFNEEDDYIAENWHEILKSPDWIKIDEVNEENLNYEAKAMISIVKEYLKIA
jgi:hypothetical protein